VKGQINAFGHTVSIVPAAAPAEGKTPQQIISRGLALLSEYKAGKQALEQKLIDNEKWFKLQYWDLIRRKTASQDPEPVTAYLLNTLMNKHADALDNFPEPNILPRKAMDRPEAKRLSGVVPFVYENVRFKRTYSRAWWYKLKHGFAIYGQFWDAVAQNGLGDIAIRYIDGLNVFWEPGVTDIQDSANVFVVGLMNSEVFTNHYPQAREASVGSQAIQIGQYVHDDNIDLRHKTLVIDWYYRERVGSRTVLHMRKFTAADVLYDSKDDPAHPEYADRGIYDHGEYPLFFDVLFPEEGTPVGFGFIDVVKNPQMYVDKLDQIITKNALMAGKQRFFVKQEGTVNINQFKDWSQDIIECNGNVGEDSIREFQARPLDPFIIHHRQAKINELKETSATNDFNRGEAAGGVTAAAAIQALQEAGNKVSRDMIQESYQVYSDMVYMTIELIAQFYDVPRDFRIRGTAGDEYVTYTNAGLRLQPVLGADNLAVFDPHTGEPMLRKPLFDVRVKPERNSPFSKMAYNELAKELFAVGFFNPQRAPEALIALKMLSFEGKDEIVQAINDNNAILQQLAQTQALNAKLAAALQKLTGRPFPAGDAGGEAPAGAGSPGGGPLG